MSHYECLGVPRDASEADIKRAWQAASSKAHPDREGGSHDAQAAANEAYRVLGDPELRANYDATGASALPPSLEVQARAVLFQIINAALDKPDKTLTLCRRMLEEQRLTLPKRAEELKAQRDLIKSRLSKVNVTNGDNLLHMVMEQKIEGIGDLLQKINQHQLVLDKARELLERHSQAPDNPTTWGAITGSGTITGGTIYFQTR